MKTFLIDNKGNRWWWNCGWRYARTDNGKYNCRALGHKEFRRCIKIADREQLNAKTVVLGDKPFGEWRRYCTGDFMYEHKFYGLVQMLATDGVHAIVKDCEGNRLQVHFTNLTEIPQDNTVAGGEKIKVKRVKKKKVDDGLFDKYINFGK